MSACDRCAELTDERDAALADVAELAGELRDVRVELARLRSEREAVARSRHPSNQPTHDMCPPRGIRRPDLRLIGGGR